MDIATYSWRTHAKRMMPAGPRTSPPREVGLTPGGLVVVDSFVDEATLAPLAKAMDSWRDGIEFITTANNGARVKMMQSSMDATACGGTTRNIRSCATPDWAGGPTYALIRELLGRMSGYVNTHIEVLGSTLGASARFSRSRGLHLTHWSMYDYIAGSATDEHRVQPHVDSHWQGRCLSSALHLDNGHANESDAGLTGGVFHTHTCKRKADCEGLGGARLADLERNGRDAGPEFAATLLEPPAQTAAFRPGRLLAFLAETPHSVTPLTHGSRRILFAFFSCHIPSAGPPREEGESIQPPPLSRYDARTLKARRGTRR